MTKIEERLQRTRELRTARGETDRLLATLRPASWLEAPIPFRHPFLFYLGHLEAFDWNLLGKRVSGEGALDSTLDDLFSFGIDPPTDREPSSQARTQWPRLEQVIEYVRRSRERVDALLESVPLEAMNMAIEHRLMHVETLIYMLHQAPYDSRMIVDPAPLRSEGNPGSVKLMDIPAGEAVVGRMPGEEFGWDNEFHEVRSQEEPFAVSKYKVTNGQYLEFVKDGGEPAPFWRMRDGKYRYRGFYTEHEFPESLPVYVTQRQALAFAAWWGGSIPTEAQHGRYAGADAFSCARELATSVHADPVSVTFTPEHTDTNHSACSTPYEVKQAVGNGWEWTKSNFEGLPGFAPHPWYLDYSQAFFTDSHKVVKGASGVTSARLIRPTFRNWFRDDYPYAYTTFRVTA